MVISKATSRIIIKRAYGLHHEKVEDMRYDISFQKEFERTTEITRKATRMIQHKRLILACNHNEFCKTKANILCEALTQGMM